MGFIHASTLRQHRPRISHDIVTGCTGCGWEAAIYHPEIGWKLFVAHIPRGEVTGELVLTGDDEKLLHQMDHAFYVPPEPGPLT